MLYADLLNLQLYPPPSRSCLHDRLLRPPPRNMASLPDYIDTNREVLIGLLPHTKNLQNEKGQEAVRVAHLRPLLLESKKG
jgi:hypothetical protein